mmetsp:Transcript_33264/g.66192  ORF Transcript_33264/g.66192 Transcript_33264/m.66192 type:complete len:302 (-) Transcript_33264:1701-2606(-)
MHSTVIDHASAAKTHQLFWRDAQRLDEMRDTKPAGDVASHLSAHATARPPPGNIISPPHEGCGLRIPSPDLPAPIPAPIPAPPLRHSTLGSTSMARRIPPLTLALRISASDRVSRLDEVLDGALDIAIVLEHQHLVELPVLKAHLREVLKEGVPLACRGEVGGACVEVLAVLCHHSIQHRVVNETHRLERRLDARHTAESLLSSRWRRLRLRLDHHRVRHEHTVIRQVAIRHRLSDLVCNRLGHRVRDCLLVLLVLVGGRGGGCLDWHRGHGGRGHGGGGGGHRGGDGHRGIGGLHRGRLS